MMSRNKVTFVFLAILLFLSPNPSDSLSLRRASQLPPLSSPPTYNSSALDLLSNDSDPSPIVVYTTGPPTTTPSPTTIKVPPNPRAIPITTSSSSPKSSHETVVCFFDPEPDGNSTTSTPSTEENLSISNDGDGKPRKQISQSLIRGSHQFSLDILRFLSNFESKDSSEGIVISPFSVWSSLIVVYMGAKGETSSEIKAALRLAGIPKGTIGSAYEGLRLWYNLKSNASESSVFKNRKFAYSAANRIFVHKDLKISRCITDNFPTEVDSSLDFVNKADSAMDSINSWVESLTRGKIKHLLSPGMITPWTQLIVTNGVYFRSQWLSQFDPSENVVKEFVVSPVEAMNVTFMRQTSGFMYGTSEKLGAQILDLPYADQQFSMMIILPEIHRGVDALVRGLQPEDIYNIINNSLYYDDVEVWLPKFKMEQEFDLAGPLFSMGVKKLFDPRFADLSAFFTNDTKFDNGVTVNNVVQKTAIEVNEEGTEAAAATAIVMSRSGRPLFPTKFVANRPFVFLLRDTATNVILFTGIVRRPNTMSMS